MKKINLRESLLELDKQTGFKYTLTDLYEACMLGEDDKKKLVQYVADRDIKGMSNMLSNAAGVMTENVADDLTDDEVLESLPGMGLPNLPNPLSEECDDATLSLQATSKLEDIEYIMSYEMADFVVYDGDKCGEYRVGYDSGYTLDIRFDLNAPGYVYYINGEGPYETMSDETIKSDIKRELDSVLWGSYVNNKKKTLGESLEKGDEITLWWKDPSWDKTAPCYARVEFVGMTKDGKYKFMSLTYGHAFIVDVVRNEITTPDGKTFNLDNSSGWMRVFNKSVNETFNPGDLVYVKPSKKTGRVKSVKGDNVEVEVNGGNDPDRIDTFYNTDLELQDNVEEGWNPNMTDCPTCGDTSFDSKKGRCGKCGYRESLQEYWPYDDDEEDSEYEYIARKYVQDSDGFQTEYTWYKSPDGLNVFVFGDSELYTPEDGSFDHEEENDDAAQEWFDSYVGFGDDLVDLVDFDEGMTKDALVESKASDDGKVFYEFRDARGYTVHELDDVEVTDDAQAIMAGKSNPKVITVTKFINGSRKPDEVLWERESDRWYLSRYVGGAEYEYAEGGYYYETLTLDGSLEFATKEEAMEELKNQVKEYDEGELVFMNDTEARFKFGKYIGDVEELHVERERGLHSSGKKVYEDLDESKSIKEATLSNKGSYNFGCLKTVFFSQAPENISEVLIDTETEYVCIDDAGNKWTIKDHVDEHTRKSRRGSITVENTETGKHERALFLYDDSSFDMVSQFNELVYDYYKLARTPEEFNARYGGMNESKSTNEAYTENPRELMRNKRSDGAQFDEETGQWLRTDYNHCGEPIELDDHEYARVDGRRLEAENKKTLNERDFNKVQKRIARVGEFDNGKVMHNDWKVMSIDDSEELAKQKSLENPDDTFYVQYDDIMNPSSDVKWRGGQRINEVTDDPKSWPNDKVLTYEDALALAKAYYSQGGDGFYETADKSYFDYLTTEYGPQTVKQMKQSFGVFDSVAKDRMCEAIKYPNGQPVSDIDLDKALDYQYGTDRDPDNSTYTDDEKQRAVNYWMDKTDPRPDGKSYMSEAVAPDYSPKQTGKAFKVFRVKNGKLYPPMVANPGGADTPVGVWLTAEEGEFAGVSKTGRPQVKSIGSGTLSYRPGWHLGDIPRASQFDRTNKETGEKEFPRDFVWAECDYVMDVDYQPESDEQGYMRMDKDGKPYRSDKYQHSLAGLPKLPKDGYYKYRTNPRPDTVPWVITGAIKVNKLLSDAEVNNILQSKGIEPIHRQGGDKTLAELGL